MAQRMYDRLLARVAHMYYNQELSQQEIAERVGVSRPKVSRMLSEAREQGIVQIIIRSPLSFDTALESRLESMFGLREAVVVSGEYDSDSDLINAIGEAAAEYLLGAVKPGDTVGISWGRTLSAMVDHLEATSVEGLRVVQLVGGLNGMQPNLQAAELARRLSKKLGADLYLLHAPAKVPSRQVRDALAEDPEISRLLQVGRDATIAVVGIGSVSPEAPVISTGIVPSDWLETLVARGGAGDICLHYYDLEGRNCAPEFDELIVGITLEDLARVPTVICVAGGREKARGVLGALRGRLCSVLVTDRHCAERALDMAALVDETRGDAGASG